MRPVINTKSTALTWAQHTGFFFLIRGLVLVLIAIRAFGVGCTLQALDISPRPPDRAEPHRHTGPHRTAFHQLTAPRCVRTNQTRIVFYQVYFSGAIIIGSKLLICEAYCMMKMEQRII